MLVQQFVILQIETTRKLPELEFTEFPWAASFLFLTISFRYWKKRGFCGDSKCYKDMFYNKTSVHLKGARLLRAGSITLEGVDRNAAALSELRGKYWLPRPFLFGEKNQYSRVHHTGRHFGVFFPFFSRWVPAMWNKLRVTPGKNS